MKKSGAWLVRYALEQIGVKYTFGIPGVHNTEIYDELNKSEKILPILVTHEGNGAFMADAISRTSDSIGTLLIVPAAGATHAASGIGEAFLDGIPMLVISGGVRSDSAFQYQLHDMDQHTMLGAITKGTFKIGCHAEIIPLLYQAYELAISGEPGPVFVEVPVNIQLYSGEVSAIVPYVPQDRSAKMDSRAAASDAVRRAVVGGAVDSNTDSPDAVRREDVRQAAKMLNEAKSPGLFLGWGAVDASAASIAIAEMLGAPVATTLQGLSAFPACHPLHTGMSFGPAAVPAATNAFKNCDCLLAVGTRFAEIGTGSFGVTVPENLIHIDINPAVFSANYPAKIAVEGDAGNVLVELLAELKQFKQEHSQRRSQCQACIAADKQAYAQEWLQHDNKDRVNPARFFQALRQKMRDDDFLVVDDGNHTFLTAELMPIHRPRRFISPTDFNCMGYAVPATMAVKLANPEHQVVGIVGDGAFLMTCMEIVTARSNNLGVVFAVFNDGELSQISQAQQVPYNRKTCTVLGDVRMQGIAIATGAHYVRMENDAEIEPKLAEALQKSAESIPVILDIHIDYSKKTRFTKGIVGTNLKRLPFREKVKMISRALARHVTG